MKNREPFDLIFLDIVLDKMNGVEAGRIIREQMEDNTTQIIFISSKENYTLQLFKIRPFDFLVKPVHYEHIEQVMDAYIKLFDTKKIFLNIKLAKRIGTEVEVKLAAVEEKFMPGLDLNVLLSNLLENAIDALKNVENKKLDIYIHMDKGVLYISISNTYHEIKLQQGKLMSFKRNYMEQGIGLENVQKMVDKYSGKMNINYDGNLFRVDVLLMLEFS
ncbi:MAG: GHKL domain-containing protein [Eubacterium sp.]|nr:GHKL domain-containing protein [Eubacterium sp.]